MLRKCWLVLPQGTEQIVSQEWGYSLPNKIRPNKLFITMKDAHEEATLLTLATSTPVYIFECVSVVEIKKVEYMSKSYNVRGELIPNE